MDFFILAIGIVVAGYFIGDGLKNFNNPNAKNLFQRMEERDEHELIKEGDVHHYIGVSKEGARVLLKDPPYYVEWKELLSKKNCGNGYYKLEINFGIIKTL